MNDELKRRLTDLFTRIRDVDDLEQVSGSAAGVSRIDKLPGDASTRRYYRVFLKPGTEPRSLVVMCLEPFSDQGENLDFISVQKHLLDSGVTVPLILGFDADRGLIFLEDLGDVTLLRRLQDVCSADVERHLYERVIDELVRMQVKATQPPVDRKLETFSLAFDQEKLMWEVNFTIEHFYEKHLNRNITPEDRKILTDGFGEICAMLAKEPRVFTHRDFHSRNVMLVPGSRQNGEKDERLVLIDFQDARMGPAQYDLVSLLKDSYYQLEEAQIERLLDYYLARWEALSGDRAQKKHFRLIFDLMSVQRNFKAIGSFASFLNRRGNATYLKYIGNTFENIRRTFLKYPRYGKLREVLFHYYYF